MPTVAQFVVPADEVALTETFRQLPDVRVALEKSAVTGDDAPLRLWVTGGSEPAVREAFDADPSVDEVRKLAESEDGRLLFDLDVGPAVELVQSLLLAEGGVVLSAVGHDGRWTISCRYPDHESLSAVGDLLEEQSFEHDVQSVEQVSETTYDGAELSDDQYQALECACRQGYFEVPRQATLADVADELGISHQALSERIRRGLAGYLQSDFPTEDDEQRPEIEPRST